jgi:glycosyltransferase involved in cell wall biosynthesis
MRLLRDRKGIKIFLVCTGRPYKPFHPKLLEAVQAYGLQKQVMFLGSVSPELLATCYKRAHFIVFPSLLEGLSQSLLESLYHFKAIVAAKQSSIPETIGDAGLLFDALNVDEIADVLERAWLDTGLLKALRAKTRANLARYKWDRALIALTACYKYAAGWTLTANEREALDRALLEYSPEERQEANG